jgi:hypothetical protein
LIEELKNFPHLIIGWALVIRHASAPDDEPLKLVILDETSTG